MTEAAYRNHQHYIAEGWSSEPKESFKALASIVANRRGGLVHHVLDVGCATGELLGFLSARLQTRSLVGVDVAEELLATGRRLLPEAEFTPASALDLPAAFSGRFDLVCAVGCMSIFDDTQIGTFWDNLLRVAAPGGLIIVLSPLNEYGVDAIIRHRKRSAGIAGPWESGWNIFSQATISEIVAGRGWSLNLQRFEIPFDLARREDPIRTWTLRTEDRPRQLTNGLKLLVDHYFMVAERSVSSST